MALFNTINFLPSVFQSPTNRRFLGATVDQLVTDPATVPLNGYIGRRFSPTYKVGDNYIPETNLQRQHYQLEPSVVVKNDNKDVVFTANYVDLLNSIANNNGITHDHQRLFSAESYSYDSKFDYDKFVNYYNYYWLPNGPAAVPVITNEVPYTKTFTVTRNTTVGGYTFTGTGSHPNVQLTLARGGTYTFNIDQPGIKFWIQSSPGVSGVDPNISTINSRQVFGVKNNGTAVGSVTFNVPLDNAQDFYSNMPIPTGGIVDAAVGFKYTDIQNQLLSTFLSKFPTGLDGIANDILLQNAKFVFVANDRDDTYWTTPTIDSGVITQTQIDSSVITQGSIIDQTVRTSVWKVKLIRTIDGQDYLIQLVPDITINIKEKVFIRSGKTYASNQFWLDNSYRFQSVPVLTATRDYLYYQDSENPDFYGQIKLVNNSTSTIDVENDILGQAGYTSPNGVIFTNGLKVVFDSFVTPSTYAGKEYYVEGVGTGIALVPVTELVVPESFSANLDITPDYITINRSHKDRNPWSRSNRWFHKDVITATAKYNQTNIIDYGPNIPGRRPIIEFDAGLQLFEFGRDAKPAVNYVIVNKSAQTLKFGSRYTMLSVGTTDFTLLGAESNTVGTTFTATRDGMAEDGTGTTTTDAFNDFEGEPSVIVDGNRLKDGDRIVFVNDYDTNILQDIWQVKIERINNTNYLTLNKTADSPALTNQNVLVTDGQFQGKTFRFTGTDWKISQEKTSANQPPMFDLVDVDGYSFSNAEVYPGLNAGKIISGQSYIIQTVGNTDYTLFGAADNEVGTVFTATQNGTNTAGVNLAGTGVVGTFTGSQLFGYAIGTGANDTSLGFPLSYRNFNNIGDILFNNYYDTESFSYTLNLTETTVAHNSGYMLINDGLTSSVQKNNWVKTIEDTGQYQIFTKFFDGNVVTIDTVEYAFVQIDILPRTQTVIPHTKVYLNNKILKPTTDFQIIEYGAYTIVTLNTMPTVGDKIDVAILSDEPSSVAYYKIPDNLNYNPLNEDFTKITLGQLRTHYNQLIENTAYTLSNNIPIQDHYIKTHGGTLTQHSAPMIYGMTFLNDPLVNFTNGLDLARKEYTTFKNKFLSLCSTTPNIDKLGPIAGVDLLLKNINAIKNITFPWYYSDMVPQGDEYTTITYTVLNVRQTNYKITNIFNNTQLSNRAVLVYVNGVQQVLGLDFTFSKISPAIIFSRTLTINDVITIREYSNTDGNYIPETPTKLGLYPKFDPAIYVDNTYQTPITVVRGHDGSITPSFGDFRDDYLLELELRIYNNIKADYSKNQLNMFDIIPGRFRTTEYTLEEYNTILSQNFLSWVGKNAVNYVSNKTFNANNSWTWNYSSYSDRIDGSPLQGSWRAIYRYWYDTDTPNLTPWVMLGFTDKPSWWNTRYGSGPYTKGNLLLWEDLQNGYIWNNDNPYTDSRFARPGLLNFIPVDTAGNLLSPTEIPLTSSVAINQFNTAYSAADFSVGQQGPAETAWRRSSDYPYAMQLCLALTKPARYFATQLDTSRFFTNTATGQFSNANNKRISPSLLAVNGDATSGTIQRTSGYINWIGDVIKNVGIDPITKVGEYLSNLSTQLTYKVGGFTDNKILTVTSEQSTPGSSSGSVIIPDTNYNIYLSKSVPVLTATYSAVIVEKTLGGYAVSGYDPSNPFFTIIPSVANNKTQTVTVNDLSVHLYQENTQTAKTIPYGTEFVNVQQVADFLISYERYLLLQGFKFDHFDRDLQETRNWTLSVQELLYWAQQGWTTGTIIVLNPVATSLTMHSVNAVVDEITNVSTGSKILDQNFLPVKKNNFNIVRTENYLNGNDFIINTLNGSMIAYAKLDLVQHEHTIVFDNVDNFGDIIYIPSEGTRQYRLKLSGHKTGAWTGALSAPGFVYNDPIINSWNSGVDYRRGDIVKYNNFYYTATQNIAASTTFNTTLWTQLERDQIQTGLLPNFGFNAHQFNKIYDVDNPPINETFQDYSASLIGFRQRQYLTDLGISVPTQTKFYQGYIKEKGSMNSISALTNATFNNVTGNINVYEEWAFRAGLYGGLNNNTYKEFVLDQSVFTTNPVAFTSSSAYSVVDNIVNLNGNAMSVTSNVYTSSNTLTTTTSLYSNRTSSVHITDLPTVGYVNIDDADYTVFDINNVSNTVVSSMAIGENIWTAKNTDGLWDILRVNETNLTATTLTYALDSYGQLTFNAAHNFVVGDTIVLKNFSAKFDGLYVVQNVPNNTNITITISNYVPPSEAADTISALQTLIRTVKITGAGTVYRLGSANLGTLDDIDSIEPINGWIENDRVWIDADDAVGATGWAVYTYIGGNWMRTRQQQEIVDLNSVSRTFPYNKSNNNILATLDYIDPAKGKILNSVAPDIDYQLTTDPALYNNGNVTLHSDLHWGPQQVGQIWWNLDTIRYINYEQDSLAYRLNHWGERFPGSTINVYQWVESTVIPSKYTTTYTSGTPVHADDTAYCSYGYVSNDGTVQLKYYFWVSNLDTVNESAGKKNSIVNISIAIENPQNQGIPYVEILRNDTVALYNVNHLLLGKNSVVHLGSTNGETNLIHSEYALVQEGNPQSQVPSSILNKLIDSLSGIDRIGQVVPDPALPPSQRYGTSIRPRQTMVMDRALALDNYITMVNRFLLDYPVTERKVLTILNTSEDLPSVESGRYDFKVDSVDELAYINVDNRSPGYKVLVTEDTTQLNKWAIYTLDSNKSFSTIAPEVQSYKTNLYWSYADWFNYDLYDPTVAPDVVVANRLELGKLTLEAGQTIKVLNNGNNQFVVYVVDSALGLTLVGIENGTIQLSTGTIPGTELRQILTSMQQDIFIDDLAARYNEVFFALVKYILTEQKNIEWAFKTSFISASQGIRKLEQFPSYVPDNQDFYIDYINEVKPYRTVVREFIIDYIGTDTYASDVTDFDLPPYWDANLLVYRSPNGDQIYDSTIRSLGVNSQWNSNYKYTISDLVVQSAGSGYISPPEIIIQPYYNKELKFKDTGTGATAYSILNDTGGIESIVVTNPGSGYTTTPNVIINGTGTGALATVVFDNAYTGNNTGHNLVRSITTKIKLDRVTYTHPNNFVSWNSITTANVGQVISANTFITLDTYLYKLDNNFTINANVDFPTFRPSNTIEWTKKTQVPVNTYITHNSNVYLTTGNVYGNDFNSVLSNVTLVPTVSSIDPTTLSNANDRITAFKGNVDLNLLVDGVDYPGVKVDGNTYTGSYYDTNIQSAYTSNIGIRPSDIVIDGGAYVGRYSSHAPEELIPGRMFDSLNMTVYDTSRIGFRIFDDMNQNTSYYRIAEAGTTTLSQPLGLTDQYIYVDDITSLPTPNPTDAIPGIVFINGEKIIYYTHDVENSRLGQLRRAVDGTSPSLSHAVGSRVVDASVEQVIPYTDYGRVTLYSNTSYNSAVATSISYRVELTSNVSANIGDIITQVGSDGVTITSTMRVLETVQDVTALPVNILDGTITGVPEVFDGPLGFDAGGVDEYRIAANVAPVERLGVTLPAWSGNTTANVGSAIFYDGNVYTVTGNVYASTFADISVQHTTWVASNTSVSTGYIYYNDYRVSGDRGNTYIVTGNVYANTFANVISSGNVHLAFEGNTAVTLNPWLTEQFDGNQTLADLTLQVGDQWWNTDDNSLYQWDGFGWNSYTPSYAGLGFDNSTAPIRINGSATTSYIKTASIIGTVDSEGIAIIPSSTILQTGNVWYNRGLGTATDGTGLINSTTEVGLFLKASLSFSATPGQTP